MIRILASVALSLVALASAGAARAQLPCEPVWELSFGSLGQGPLQFGSPSGLAVAADGSLWIADYSNLNVRHFSADGAPLGSLTMPVGFTEPGDVAVGPDGRLFVVDLTQNQLLVYSPSGTLLSTITGGGSPTTVFNWIFGVAAGPDGSVYATDRGRDRVYQFDAGLNFVRTFGGTGPTASNFDEPFGIAVCPTNGDVYVVTHGPPGPLHRFDRNGNHLASSSTHIDGTDVAVDADGNAYVADYFPFTQVEVLSPDGSVLCHWGKEGDEPGSFNHVFGLATRDGRIYVSDNGSGRILRFGAPPVSTNAVTWGRLKQIYR